MFGLLLDYFLEGFFILVNSLLKSEIDRSGTNQLLLNEMTVGLGECFWVVDLVVCEICPLAELTAEKGIPVVVFELLKTAKALSLRELRKRVVWRELHLERVLLEGVHFLHRD